VSDDKLSSMKVRIFNTAGIPIDVVYGEGTNEVRWQNPSLRRGIYVYVMEVVMQNGKKGAYRGVLEVYE